MPEPTVTPSHGSYLLPHLDQATVADAMHPGILSCEPDATLTDVATMMATHHVHCIAVVGISHEQPECFVWAIISDLDLVRAGVADGAELTAREVAKEPVVVVEPDMPLREAAREMLAQGVSHLVVADSVATRPIGVLSTLDLAGVLAWGEG
jgi:CBS domain-containing protein